MSAPTRSAIIAESDQRWPDYFSLEHVELSQGFLNAGAYVAGRGQRDTRSAREIADELFPLKDDAPQAAREAAERRRRGASLGVVWVRAQMGIDDAASDFMERLLRIQGEIELGMDCDLLVGHDDEHTPGRYYFQITCWRRDTITGEMGRGYGGKAYLSPHATDSELIQTAFGLYKGYWEHEARETFLWRERRPFGPHISTEALWEVSRRVDVRSAQHVEDRQP